MIDELIWIIFFWKIISGPVNFPRIEFYHKSYYSFPDIEALKKVWSEYLAEIANFADNLLVSPTSANADNFLLS